MNRLLSSRGLFALGLLVLLLTNVVLFSGVASNRSGLPDAQLLLTENELNLPYWGYSSDSKENSGLSLGISWKALGRMGKFNSYDYSRSPAWFDGKKLEELGFRSMDSSSLDSTGDSFRAPIAKEVFLVLEYDGEPYQEYLRRLKDDWLQEKELAKPSPESELLQRNEKYARERYQGAEVHGTRLFAIDAGLDPDRLRLKYADRGRFIIAKGLVKPRYDRESKESYGYIRNLSVTNIHVPLRHRKALDLIVNRDRYKNNNSDLRPPRFEVELAYGSRFEPWVVAVRPLIEKQ